MKAVKAGLLGLAVMAAIGTPTPAAHAANAIVYDYVYRDGSAHVYDYNPWQQFEINTEVGYVTDIQLRPDETVTKIGAGNTAQWSIDTDVVAGVQHVYIKPTVANQQTNLVINTDKRSYRLLVNSTDSHEYVVLWRYIKEDAEDNLKRQQEEVAAKEREATQYRELAQRAFNTRFEVKKNKRVQAEYIPLSVFDDGTKTYIQVRPENKDNFPTVYAYEPWDRSKLQLVNYRLKGDYLEIDKVLNGIKLTFSQDSYLLIERQGNVKKAPSPKSITFASVNVDDLYAATKGQTNTVQVSDTWVPLKERMRRQRQEEQVHILKELKEPPPAETSADTEELDKKIAALEEQLGVGAAAPAGPAMQPVAGEDTAKAQEEAERAALQEKINSILGGETNG